MSIGNNFAVGESAVGQSHRPSRDNNISLYRTIGFGMSFYGLQLMLAYLIIGILL